MRVLYRRRALSDLRELEAWYQERSPDAYDKVYADLIETIDILRMFPLAFRAEGRGRIATSAKFRYSITYLVFDDRVEVTGFYRHQNR